MGDCATEDLCQACLASGRRLFSISTLKSLVTESQFWEIISRDGGMCWECKSILQKFTKLKQQAHRSQLVLAKASEGLPIATFSQLSVNIPTYHYYYIQNDTPLNIEIDLRMNSDCKDSDLVKEEAGEASLEFDVPFSNVFVADVKAEDELKVDRDPESEVSSAVKDDTSLVNGTAKKPRYFKCDVCSLRLKSKNSLRCHIRRIHAVQRDFTCEVCKRAFASKSRYESHRASHGGAAARQLAYCAPCDTQYKNIYIYRLHLRTSAAHQTDYVECPECKKRFANRTYFKRHYSFFHLNTSNFKCDQCDKKFISVTSLKSHNEVHHSASRQRNFACDLCAKKFHMEDYQTAEGVKEEVLDYGFVEVDSHDVHQLCTACLCATRTTHTLDDVTLKQYYMNILTEMQTASTLRKHRLIHSAARNYMCTQCGDTFKQNPALYTHMRLVHQGHKRPTRKHSS